MTPRQQRRLEQKLARKAERKEQNRARKQAEPLPPTPPAAPLVQPISEARLTANRANAQLSTGAITEAGKVTVSQNATKHGLTGKFKVLPSESQSQFDQLLAGFLRSEAPVGDEEIQMVHQMAEALWLSRRCVRLQNDCFAALESGTPDSAKGADARRQTGEECLQPSGGALETAPVLRARSDEQRAAHKSLALYMRYQTTHDRTFTRYATELRKRRNERARIERGFVSQQLKEAADRRREEMHQARQALQSAKQEAQQIRNRLAAARAERLELQNSERLQRQIAPNQPKALSAAA